MLQIGAKNNKITEMIVMKIHRTATMKKMSSAISS